MCVSPALLLETNKTWNSEEIFKNAPEYRCRVQIRCQWQQSEGRIISLLGCGLDHERLSFLAPPSPEFPDELMFKPSSAAAAAPARSCWHVQEDALSSPDTLLYQSSHGLHVPHGTALDSGAAIRDLCKRCGWTFFWGRKILHPFISTIEFYSLNVCSSHWIISFYAVSRSCIPIWEEQELLQCSRGRLMLLQHLGRTGSSFAFRQEDWYRAAQRGQASVSYSYSELNISDTNSKL